MRQSNPQAQKEDSSSLESNEGELKLDILQFGKNKIPKVIQFFMYALTLIGGVLIMISFGCMLFNPGNKSEYLNNHQLSLAIDDWEKSDIALKYKSYQLKLTVKSYIVQRPYGNIPFIEGIDKNFNLTKKAGYFQQEFIKNQFEFGVFDFEPFNIPLGNSAEYCLQISFFDKMKKLIYHKNSFQSLLNNPVCVLESNNKYDLIESNGVKIQPWKQAKKSCKDCSCEHGIIQHIDGKPYCFQYEILSKVCIIVSENDSKQIEYVSGCYKEGQHQIFTEALPHQRTTFQELLIEIREKRDPYIVALQLSTNNIPIQFENANFPVIIRYIFEVGLGCIITVVMMNIAYKANRSPRANLSRKRINTIIQFKDK